MRSRINKLNMRKYLWSSLAAGGLALSSLNSHAISYRDLDVLGGLIKDTSVTGEFNLVVGDGGLGDRTGFNHLTEQITSATATFSFIDDADWAAETVTIKLGSFDFLNETTLATVLFYNGSVIGNALFDLQQDGILKYTITANGDFYSISADLRAEASPIGSVPDGGSTLSLLGVACLGLGWASRKMKSL
jgi:hypothetical protein